MSARPLVHADYMMSADPYGAVLPCGATVGERTTLYDDVTCEACRRHMGLTPHPPTHASENR